VRLTPELWEKAKARKLQGETWKAIANDLQLTETSLFQKASKSGFGKLAKEVKEVSLKKKTESLESLSALVRSKLAADAASTLERIEGYSLDGIKDEATRETILGSVAKRSALVFGWSEQGEAASVSINLLGSMPDRNFEVQVTNESDSK
jgi:hypothetical protein